MNVDVRLIEQRLRETSTWWKWQLILRRSSDLAMLVMGAVLLLSLGMVLGWFTSSVGMTVAFVLLGLAALVAWVVIGVLTLDSGKDDPWLAAAVERAYGPLMDRLNTLVFLRQLRDKHSQAYADAITEQTVRVLDGAPLACPFSWRRTWAHLGAFLAMLSATICFWGYFHPWRQLQMAQLSAAGREAEKEFPGLEIPPIEEAQPEPQEPRSDEPWGQVRISEPGRDLRVTRLDVVPVQIEASARRPLARVEWFTAVGGQDEIRRDLPPPEDPRYAVYRPEIRPEDYRLENWDVLSYYAQATTEDGQTFKSAVYFIELIPFRDELENLPGGTKGPAYAALQKLSAMIEWQQEVIRQTGRLPLHDEQNTEDPRKQYQALSQEEGALGDTAEHLAAELESRFDESAIEGIDEHLERAGSSLADAQVSLAHEDAEAAPRHERRALGDLIATRKDLLSLMLKNPDAFLPNQHELAAAKNQGGDGNSPSSQNVQERLDRLEEEQDQIADAQRSLDQLISRQRQIDQFAWKHTRFALPQVAEEQRRVGDSLRQLRDQRPSAFRDLEPEADTAQDTIDQAAQSLDQQDDQAQHLTAEATRQLEKLADGMNRETERLQLARAQTLKDRLDKNIEQYAKIEKQPDQVSQAKVKETTGETKDLLSRLTQLAEQKAAEREDAGTNPTQLTKELADQQKEQLDGQCDRMCERTSASERKQSAGAIRRGLETLSKALAADSMRQSAELGQAQIAQQIEQVGQRMDQIEAARQFVQHALQQQRGIEQAANPRARNVFPELAKRQENLSQSLEDSMAENPTGFRNSLGQCQRTKSAMHEAAKAFRAGDSRAQQHARQATTELERLGDTLEKQQQQNALADAYRLKRMLDDQIEQLKQLEQNPSDASPGMCQRAGGQCKSLTRRLKQVADQLGASGSFGPELSESLNDQNQRQLDAQSDRLSQARSPSAIQSAARQLGQGLSQVSRAMDASAPNTVAQRRPGDPLKPNGPEAIAKGARQLESVARRDASQQRMAPQDRGRLKGEALANLAEGISSEYGYNERSQSFLERLRSNLEEPNATVNMAEIQALVEQIQMLRREVALQDDPQTDQSSITNMDASKLPPEYRASIEKYFERLSERP